MFRTIFTGIITKYLKIHTMKTFFFFLIPFLTFGQFNYYQTNEKIYVFSDKNCINVFDSLVKEDVYIIIDKINEETSYISYYSNRTGYVKNSHDYRKISKIEFDNNKHDYKSRKFKEYSESLKKNISDSILLINKQLIKIFPKNKLYLISSNVIQNTYTTGVKVAFYNSFNIEFKYIEFVCQGYNRVGDPETEIKTLKLIGPIQNSDLLSHSFEDVFISSVIEEIKVKKIILTKFDNTKIYFQPNQFKITDTNILETLITYVKLINKYSKF